MADVLADILAKKHLEVEHARRVTPVEALRERAEYSAPLRDFFAAVATHAGGRLASPQAGDATSDAASPGAAASDAAPTGAAAPGGALPRLIAEVKRASPSAGVIRADFDPVAIAQRYHAAGAAALSVLTDGPFFGGRLTDLAAIRSAVPLPLLRKDFIIDAYQVHESRAAGADAILLIAEALRDAELVDFVALARRIDLTVLLEVHEAESLERVQRLFPTPPTGVLLGINNRDLKRQVVDIAHTERLAPRARGAWPLVSESGVRTRADVQRLHAAGARALLVGEALMRADDPGGRIQELFAG
ncbi:MAG: indole-3-glycerol phosphate synthase TrpC [Phycisphaerae bacterium]